MSVDCAGSLISQPSGVATIVTPKALTDDELIAIHALTQRGMDPVRIAQVLKRSRATVYRHLDRLARMEASLPAPKCCVVGR